MNKLMAIRMVLLVAISLSIGLASASVTYGQAGRSDVTPPPPPPKPMPSPAVLDLGKIEGTKYTNDQLGFSFSAPATWIVRDSKDLMAMREAARKPFEAEKDPTKKAAIEGSIDRTTTLFAASKLTVSTSGGLNAFLVCLAERIPSAVITTPREYFNIMMRTMNGSAFKVEVVEPLKLVKIGTTEFGAFTIKVSTDVGIFVQKQLIAVKGLYAYGIAFSYVDNEDAPTFDDVVKTIKSK